MRGAHNWLIHDVNDRFIEKTLPFLRGTVYDLGCGRAPYKGRILEVAERYIGVDWANSLHGTEAIDLYADLNETLPVSSSAADSVVSFQVMEHLREPGQFLSECHRILRTGGHLVLSIPFLWPVHEGPVDYYRYTRFGLHHLLEKAGFEVIQLQELTGFWSTWLLHFNYHTMRFARGPLRPVFRMLWHGGQVLGPVLDGLAPEESAPSSYGVIARKPVGS
ncbi:MAG: methyltransferase domain-containing protein [Pseudomonadota bacterium]